MKTKTRYAQKAFILSSLYLLIILLVVFSCENTAEASPEEPITTETIAE